jgi:hypothetical protein
VGHAAERREKVRKGVLREEHFASFAAFLCDLCGLSLRPLRLKSFYPGDGADQKPLTAEFAKKSREDAKKSILPRVLPSSELKE